MSGKLRPRRTGRGPTIPPPSALPAWEQFILSGVGLGEHGPAGLVGGLSPEAYLRSPRGRQLLAEYVAAHPGTRPSWWWRALAPDMARTTPFEAVGYREVTLPDGTRGQQLLRETEAAVLHRLELLTPGEVGLWELGQLPREEPTFRRILAPNGLPLALDLVEGPVS